MIYGGFLRRLFAGVIDYLILMTIFFLYFVVCVVSGLAGMETWEGGIEPELIFAQMRNAWVVFHVWCLITWFAYFTFFHSFVGKTPGKMLLGLAVYPASGGRLTMAVSFLRTAGYLLSAVCFLGFLWVMVDGKKRGWHDLVAGTLVMRTGKTP